MRSELLTRGLEGIQTKIQKEEAGERATEEEKEGQLIKTRSFNNANVITCTGPHTCLAPNHINTRVVDRERERQKSYGLNMETIYRTRRKEHTVGEQERMGRTG